MVRIELRGYEFGGVRGVQGAGGHLSIGILK